MTTEQQVREQLEEIAAAATAGVRPAPGVSIDVETIDDDEGHRCIAWDLDFRFVDQSGHLAADRALERAESLLAGRPELAHDGYGMGPTCVGLSGSIDLPA